MEFETYDIIYENHLNYLKEELLAYENENDIWKLAGEIKNSPANLAIHLCGNLNHFIGAVVGDNGYVRKRDYEFSVKGLSIDDIVKEIETTKEVLIPILKNLSQEDLHKKFPTDDFGGNQSVEWVLARLGFHFGYHLGQINYHRRMINS